jgi:hypothetical protein
VNRSHCTTLLVCCAVSLVVLHLAWRWKSRTTPRPTTAPLPYVATPQWQPRTAPRPTDQHSGELLDPDLTLFLAPPAEADIPFSLVPCDMPLMG